MIDILLATYNGERFLKYQLDSIFNQTYKEFVLLIHDDGSSDGTLEIIDEYQSKYPGKIELIEDPVIHRGATLSFAYLIEHSSSDFLMFCDQDDVWLNDKIEITFNAMLSLEKDFPNQPLMIFTDLKEVEEDLTIKNHSFIKSQKLFPELITMPVQFLSLNVVAGCTMMINKRSKECILPIPSSRIVHDQWIAVNISHFGKIKYLPIPTILYRQHNSNALGANQVGYSYFIKKLFNPAKQLEIYSDLLFHLKFKVSIRSFLYYKIYFTMKRLL